MSWYTLGDTSEATPSPYPYVKGEKGASGWHHRNFVELYVSYTFEKTERYKFESSNGVPSSLDCCTIDIRAGLSSKLFNSKVSWAMLEEMPCSVLLWSPPIPEIKEETTLALSLCSSIFNFFLLEQKVLSIFGSNSNEKDFPYKGEILQTY